MTPFEQLSPADFAVRFATSVGLGLLLGMERQKNAGHKAGVRTFTLVALFGTTTAFMSQLLNAHWLIGLGLLLTGIAIPGMLKSGAESGAAPGTTTVFAIMICFCLGVTVWLGYAQLAAALAIVTAALLHFKPVLHSFIGRLTDADISSILQFAVLSLVVLPLLPNQAYGPFAVLNPYQIWLMVVLVSGLSLLGYIALKFGESNKSSWFVGIAGGVVSSTTTTLVYSRQAKETPDAMLSCSKMVVIANLVMLVRVAVVTASVAPSALNSLGSGLAAAFVFGLIGLVWLQWHDKSRGVIAAPILPNPVSLKVALGFGVAYGIVLLALAWLTKANANAELPWGHYVVAFIAGLTDVDAITISNLQLLNADKLTIDLAVGAILVALTANVLLKLGITLIAGSSSMAKHCSFSMLAVMVGLVGALVLK
jgi:uncharacterized membrane protein (DUF4010 family)